MVPRIAKAGKSFKGAGQYYLQDKSAETSERVMFTHTENMLTTDPEKALKVMAYTALHQDELKRAAYRAENPDDPECRNMHKAGRKVRSSVYHYSLAWHPIETPTKDQMIDAGRQTLKEMGLSEHECLMVAHDDQSHPHIHLIVNKIHPVTGRVADLKWTRKVLSDWAQRYERENGRIWCEERVKNNAKRQKIYDQVVEYGKTPENVVRPTDVLSFSQAEYYRWCRETTKLAWERSKHLREAQTEAHKKQIDSLYKQREREIRSAMSRIKQEMRPRWAQHFREERKHRKLLEKSLDNTSGRVGHVMTTSLASPLFDNGFLAPTFNAVVSGDLLRAQFDKAIAARKKGLGEHHGALVKQAIAQIRERYAEKISAVREEHTGERKKLRKTLEREFEPTRTATEEDYRQQRVIAALATALTYPPLNERQKTFHAAMLPDQNKPPTEADRMVSFAKARARQAGHIEAPHPFKGHSPPEQRKRSGRFPPRITVQTDLDPPALPLVAYGHEPRRVLHPKGMRAHPVQLRRPEQKSYAERATLYEQWKEQRRKEDAELVALFGSAAKAQKVKARSGTGQAAQRSPSKGRARRRGFDGG